MTTAPETLARKFQGLIHWEKRKRLEETLSAACCAALGTALLILPLNSFLPHLWLRWLVPVILLAVFVPAFLHRRRWRVRDEVVALAALDRTLDLEERAVTAWDLMARQDSSAAAQLVFQQTEGKLRAAEPRRLFPRRQNWARIVAPSLLALWVALLWLEIDRVEDRARSPQARALAERARDYAQALQEKARNEGLRESLKLAEELEKEARREMTKGSGDERFKKELAALAQKFDDAAQARSENDFAAAESGQALNDLQAELAAARDLPELAQLPKGAEDAGRSWAERLSTMPQLKRRLNDAEHGGERFGQERLKAFLDRLEKRVAGELDRRALIDAQQYLQQMMKQDGRPGENFAQRTPAPGADQDGDDGQREKNAGRLPGKEAGQPGEKAASLPEFRADVSSRVKGSLGEGESTALSFKAKPTPGKSAVPPSEVVASYRRQAEQELNSERVPAALKETIKNYFLSLGDGGQ